MCCVGVCTHASVCVCVCVPVCCVCMYGCARLGRVRCTDDGPSSPKQLTSFYMFAYCFVFDLRHEFHY